ncbi:MAG: aldehyde dehydrogenase family protein, partial [Acidimicrobiales bacterium]
MHYVDGRLVPSTNDATFDVLEPVTNGIYARCAAGSVADIDRAVAGACEAFETGPWPLLKARDRARILQRVADAIEARSDRIAELESFDTGLPISQARKQAARAAENFRFFAGLITSSHEDAFSVGHEQLNYVIRRPAGVAGLISPWNTPFMLETWKLAPALASGCVTVLKPAEWSPLSATVLPEIMEEAELPRGVFSIVHGIGEEAGAALVAHRDVPLISFTGESATGQSIMASSASNLKRLSMELGGKSPCLVFADADLGAALDAVVFQVFSLNGERCTAGTRVLVERPVYDAFVEDLVRRAGHVRVGVPSDPQTELGPLIHPVHHEKVTGYVQIGQQEGAVLGAGGRRPEHLPTGNFLSATVLFDVTPA